MSNKIIKPTFPLSFALALFTMLILGAPPAIAQQTTAEQTNSAVAKTEIGESTNPLTKPALVPVFTEYRGIRIAMSADEVRATLDHQKLKDKEQDFFVFSEAESAQVYYDKQGKVKAISVTYVANPNAPTPQAVLGSEAQAKANGSIFKRVRYPDVGYWVAYSRSAGDAPIITITMQKFR